MTTVVLGWPFLHPKVPGSRLGRYGISMDVLGRERMHLRHQLTTPAVLRGQHAVA